METDKLINNNGMYLYSDNGFNTFSIKLNLLASNDNRSAAILDILTIYLLQCNQVYKTDNDIKLKERELYDLDIDFRSKWKGGQKVFSLNADLVSMDAIKDDYSKAAFEFIRDILLKPDFTNNEMLEVSKNRLISYFDYLIDDYESYSRSLYRNTVLPLENTMYDYSVDKEYVKSIINSITLEDLKNEYNNLIGNFINGVVVGNINEEDFNNFVSCMNLAPTKKDIDYSMDINTTEGYVEIEKDCVQSYIYVTYDFTDLTNAEYRVLYSMLNSTLGLCYQTLREKYGLVYGSSSDILFHEKKLNIFGETDYSKKDKFIEACDEIVKSLCNREVVKKYMKIAKDEIFDDEYSLSENRNDLTNIISNRLLKYYGDTDRELVNKEIEEMKPEEIMDKAKSLNRKNVFMVRGKSNE